MHRTFCTWEDTERSHSFWCSCLERFLIHDRLLLIFVCCIWISYIKWILLNSVQEQSANGDWFFLLNTITLYCSKLSLAVLGERMSVYGLLTSYLYSILLYTQRYIYHWYLIADFLQEWWPFLFCSSNIYQSGVLTRISVCSLNINITLF